MKTTVDYRALFVIFLMLFGFCLSGCGAALKVGRFPDVSRIDKDLIPTASTRDDVLRILGQPKGDGGIFLPIDQHSRDCWYYYYEEGTMQDNQRVFLFIFFDGNTYDGYMWFSSFPASLMSSQ